MKPEKSEKTELISRPRAMSDNLNNSIPAEKNLLNHYKMLNCHLKPDSQNGSVSPYSQMNRLAPIDAFAKKIH